MSNLVYFHCINYQILTKDSVTVTVDAVVYFRVEKPLLAVNNSLSYEWATRLLAKTTLRNVLGAHSLAEILSEKDSIAGQMRVCSCVDLVKHVMSCHVFLCVYMC